jgi:hypothetical protein
VGPRIGGNRSAAAIAEKSREGRVGAGHESLSEDVAIRGAFGGGRRAVEGDHRICAKGGSGAGALVGDGALQEL